jgi:mRNA interferase MazF
VVAPRRGEIWWGEAPDVERRPFLVLSRDEAIPVLERVVVAPVTRTVRGIPSELPLGMEEGLRTECAATFDNLITIPKSMLTGRAGALGASRIAEACDALRAATDC